ncbi:unnamed protein product [Periconia digitata]|uniref:Uncharacterized protein n=1 Tax=Periconia digitata TaxID=1303443 RepID=A0A9W4UIN1_9PLEO|nr:unnamed protein product [Periconia digitata]
MVKPLCFPPNVFEPILLIAMPSRLQVHLATNLQCITSQLVTGYIIASPNGAGYKFSYLRLDYCSGNTHFDIASVRSGSTILLGHADSSRFCILEFPHHNNEIQSIDTRASPSPRMHACGDKMRKLFTYHILL